MRKRLNVTLYEHCFYCYIIPLLDLSNNTPQLSGIITASDANKLERTQQKFADSVFLSYNTFFTIQKVLNSCTYFYQRFRGMENFSFFHWVYVSQLCILILQTALCFA